MIEETFAAAATVCTNPLRAWTASMIAPKPRPTRAGSSKRFRVEMPGSQKPARPVRGSSQTLIPPASARTPSSGQLNSASCEAAMPSTEARLRTTLTTKR